MGAGVVHLTSLTNLKTLDVGYSLAGDASMAALSELTQLEYLDMDSCPITNTCDLHSCSPFLKHALHVVFFYYHVSCGPTREQARLGSPYLTVHIQPILASMGINLYVPPKAIHMEGLHVSLWQYPKRVPSAKGMRQ